MVTTFPLLFFLQLLNTKPCHAVMCQLRPTWTAPLITTICCWYSAPPSLSPEWMQLRYDSSDFSPLPVSVHRKPSFPSQLQLNLDFCTRKTGEKKPGGADFCLSDSITDSRSCQTKVTTPMKAFLPWWVGGICLLQGCRLFSFRHKPSAASWEKKNLNWKTDQLQPAFGKSASCTWSFSREVLLT